MNTHAHLPSSGAHAQLPSGIDLVYNDDVFDNLSKRFWEESKKAPKEERQMVYRLLWLGEWLSKSNQWKQQFRNCSPKDALHYAVIRRHHLLPADVSKMSWAELSLALTDDWTDFAGLKQLQTRIERKLDWLDTPFRFEAA